MAVACPSISIPADSGTRFKLSTHGSPLTPRAHSTSTAVLRTPLKDSVTAQARGDRRRPEGAPDLKPGGQFLYGDITVASELSESIRRDIDLWTG